MQVSGIQSDVTLDSGGGDVAVSGVGGTANVSTGGGNVSASDLGGILKFSTGGGDVNGNGLFAPQVTTDSGGGNVTPGVHQGAGEPEHHQRRGRHHYRAPARQHPLRHHEHTGGGDYSASVPSRLGSPATRSRWTAAAATSASRKAS